MPSPLRRAFAVLPLFGLAVACNDGGTQPPTMVILTVAYIGAGTGFVASVPAGIICEFGNGVPPNAQPTGCAHAFARGTQVTLTVTPAERTTFSGWSGGGCSGFEDCVVTMQENTTVSVELERDPKNLALTGPPFPRVPTSS